jgi:hypothetical protein
MLRELDDSSHIGFAQELAECPSNQPVVVRKLVCSGQLSGQIMDVPYQNALRWIGVMPRTIW